MKKLSKYQRAILEHADYSKHVVVGPSADSHEINGKPVRLSSCFKLVDDGMLKQDVGWEYEFGTRIFQLTPEGKDALRPQAIGVKQH